MSWQKLDGNNRPLEKISELTVRLLRLAAHQQLARGETQLRAAGIPAELTSPYKEHIKEESKKTTDYSNLRVIGKGSF